MKLGIINSHSILVVLLGLSIIALISDPVFVQAQEEEEGLKEGEVHIGSYGYVCTSECRKKGYSYNWCEARHPTSDLPGITYWDYCSKKENHDYRGRRCWHEHACGNHGYKYKWCYTGEDGSSWGYCGINVLEKHD